MLLQNYRSYEDIVQIPSAIFYDSRVIANLEKPADLGYSVHFYGVLGREEQAKEQPTFFNRAEAAEVADRVEELCDSWPSKYWGRADPSKICVLAPYPAQASRPLLQPHQKYYITQYEEVGFSWLTQMKDDYATNPHLYISL